MNEFQNDLSSENDVFFDFLDDSQLHMYQSSNPDQSSNHFISLSHSLSKTIPCVCLGRDNGHPTLGDGTTQGDRLDESERMVSTPQATPSKERRRWEGSEVQGKALCEDNNFVFEAPDVSINFPKVNNKISPLMVEDTAEFRQIRPLSPTIPGEEYFCVEGAEKKILRATRLKPTCVPLGGESTDPKDGSGRGPKGSSWGKPTHLIGPPEILFKRLFKAGQEGGFGGSQVVVDLQVKGLRGESGREPVVAVNTQTGNLTSRTECNTLFQETQFPRRGQGNSAKMSPNSANLPETTGRQNPCRQCVAPASRGGENIS